MALRIEDYALIGDCETAALVGRNGSIDWLCWPRFDSDACFAALLGTKDHGRWLIAPRDPQARVTRRYRRDTLILETRFETAGGAAVLVDFMPLRDDCSNIVRLVIGERGQVAMHTELILRFGYGATVPWVCRLEDNTLRAVAGPDMVLLNTPAKLHGENLTTVGDFAVSAGQTVPFVMTYAASHRPPPDCPEPMSILADTEEFWRKWSEKCQPAGPWTDLVRRSLITLKALTYAPTGGMVAAPTTSLPECIGGARNWDYRYCWLRDATLTLLTLMDAGYYDEAKAWRDWLVRAVAGSPRQIQAMYGIAGERRLTEWNVPWLPGYENSKPVHIGNDAHVQLQIDVYGEVMDALYQARCGGLAESENVWAVETEMLAHLETIWKESDEGIWEVRSGRRQFTHSKVMAWVAFDRAIKSVAMFGVKGPVDRWKKIRDEIHADVCQHGFDAERGTFVQAYGAKELDASLLLLPAVGFLPPEDPRVRGTVAAVERELMVDGVVLRYNTQDSPDGLPPGEGAFLACSFWLADAYILLGRRDEARGLFERLTAIRNDVGLLSEEYDPVEKRQLGNFPQAFSHIALVDTALNLAAAERPIEQRAQSPAEQRQTPASA
jgi:GH15 family glucan-1,4-alpha-glucosidase